MEVKEITKEDCRQLYNLYAQVETSESVIKDLEEFVKSRGGIVPDIIPKSYQIHGSIEIHIPYFDNGKFADKGARVYHISYPAALRVLKNHVRHLKKEIKQMNDKLLKGCAK